MGASAAKGDVVPGTKETDTSHAPSTTLLTAMPRYWISVIDTAVAGGGTNLMYLAHSGGDSVGDGVGDRMCRGVQGGTS